MTAPEQLGLRERKKYATRALIIEVAHRLFLSEGFDAVTLERVAADCEVSVRTILRYFKTKEALALAPEHDGLQTFRDTLGQRDCDAVTFWRRFVQEGSRLNGHEDGFRPHLRMIFDHPSLFAQLLTITYDYEDLLAEAITDETGGEDPLGARLLATMLVAGNSATVRHWLADDEPIDPAVLLRAVDYAATAFQPTKRAAMWARYAATHGITTN